MGKGGKAQTIGYKYYLGMHVGLCHGPIDAITRLRVDDRDAWIGNNTGGTINVNAPELFGGEKREGGVSGPIDVEMGGPAQGQNGYLVSKLGALIPAFRGVVGLVFRQCYLGNNPYLKTWSARGQRIHVRQDGIEQWYDEKSAVPIPEVGAISISWEMFNSGGVTVSPGVNQSYVFAPGDGEVHAIELNAKGIIERRSYPGSTPVAGSVVRGGVPGANANYNLYRLVISDPPATYYFNNGASDGALHNIDETFTVLINDGATLSYTADPIDGVMIGAYQSLAISALGGVDMNAAHIIRECLTDPEWGMGYTDDDIDETSFVAAANTFHSEGLGLSLLWDKTKSIEDFVATVQQHVDTALYVSRTTGKFILKPIRGGYDEGSLIVLDESNIESVSNPTRVAFGELVNSVTVSYWDSVTGKDASLTVTDTALVQQQGVVINSPLQYPGFTNARNATIAAQRDLRALSSPLLSCTITADSDAKVLNIGDVFKFSWAKWGLVEVVMRVNGISYGTGRNNRVKIECTQDVFDTDVNVVIVVPGPGWTDPSAPPSAVPNQLATEAPYWELVQALGQTDTDTKLTANPEVGFVVAAGSRPPSAINASLFTDDGAGYEDVGALDFCPSGVLAADITKTDTTFVLVDGSDFDEVQIGSHFQLGDELIRVDAFDVDTGEIEVGRGVLDTVPAEHAAGDVAMFWDNYVGFDPTEYVSPEEVGVKIVTVSGAGVLPISEAEEMLVELNQRAARPYAPGDFRLNGESYAPNAFYNGEVAITWKHRDRIQQTGGTLLDASAGNIGPEVGTLYRVQGYVDEVLVHTEDDIDGTSATWTPEQTGYCRVEVHAKRNDLYSWQAPSHTFKNANFRLTEDGDERYTEDNNVRSIEE